MRLLLLSVSWSVYLTACEIKHEYKFDPQQRLGCNPQTEKCIAISETEFEHYLQTLEDKAMLRLQLDACQQKH